MGLVIIPDEASRQFDLDVASVGAARRFASETAGQWGIDARDIALVVGELAANAVVHGHSPFTVRLRLSHEVSIEVSDRGAEAPHRGSTSAEAQSGRGLQIVERLSTSWGVRPDVDGGKVVWARLDD